MNAADARRSAAFLAPRPAAPTGIELSDIWINPTPSGLVARVSVTIPKWGETINACAVVRTKNGFYVLPPGIPMVGRDGTVLKDDAGKVRYKPAVVFTKDAGGRFSDAVIEALRREHPTVLAGDAG